MQHYTTTDKMLTIHADRLIKSWTLKKSISTDDARSVCEIPGLYHIERTVPGAEKGEIMPLGGFGDNYTILQHSDMLDMIADKILPELPGAKIETVGTLEGGATGMVQLDPELHRIFNSCL